MPDDNVRITVEELLARRDRGERVTLLDSRSPPAWQGSARRLPGAIRVPPGEVDQHVTRLPRGQTIVAYCT